MLLWALSCVLALGPSDDARARLEEGVAHHRKHELDAAEQAFTQAIAIDPELDEARLALGRVQLGRGKYVDAAATFEAALARPGLARASTVALAYALGRARAELGKGALLGADDRREQLRRAIAAFDRVLAIEPEHFRAHYRRALALEQLDDPEPADASYRSCIAAEPRYSACWIGLGNMYVDYGFEPLGIAVLRAGVELNREDAKLWNGLGRALRAHHELEDAVFTFERALALDADLLDAMFGLGQVYAELGRTTAAVDRLQTFLTKAGNDVPEHYKRAARDLVTRLLDTR